jgi:hypothetical protein
MQCKLIWLIPAALCCLLFLAQHSAAQPAPKPSELAAKIGELAKYDKLNEAVALVRSQAEKDAADSQLPMTMVFVADWARASDRLDTSLELYGEVIQRFPQTLSAALATCGQGFALDKQGKHKEGVAAWERGVAFYSAVAPRDFKDRTNLASGAWHALGEHYVMTRQWSKGRRAYLNWQPVDIGCGNGIDDYLSTRAYNVLLCQAHAGPASTTARLAREALACGSFSTPQDLVVFVLVRLYSESDQLDDLEHLAEDDLNSVTPAHAMPLTPGARRSRSAAFLAGIALARSRRWSDHIAAFDGIDRSKPELFEDKVRRHVAAWKLLREQNETVSAVAIAARQNKGPGGDLLAELLVNMSTTEAKESLGRLSRNSTPNRRKLIVELTQQRDLRLKKSKNASLTSETKQARGTVRSGLPMLFYEPWPSIEPGSLPSS